MEDSTDKSDILPYINEGASSKSDAYSDLHIVPASTSIAFSEEGLTSSPQALSSEEEIRTCPVLSMFKLQSHLLLILREVSFIFLINIYFTFKKFIIDETAIRDCFIQFDNLFFRRIDSISKVHLSKHSKTNKNIFIYFSIHEIKSGNAIHLLPKGKSLLANECG